MLKRLLGTLLIIASPIFIYSADQDPIVGFIGPASASSVVNTITIAAPGGGKRNCLTDFSITVTTFTSFSILDAGTTVYTIDIATNSALGLPTRSLPVMEDWYGTNALCAGYNSAMYFTLLNSTGSASTYKLNYQGVIRGR